ncbi:YicC/YloC family endoribonuclease [Ciceribacter ferrooxidans]|uniref:YicC family protein n=1 Tax=Ciceribacter ferrooxidans TaxID=2509717 RepID=A0A4Q2TGE3_9HYPH|nr:YicC/YloC family endoribonuclease [Ciceribacter ferrooxidans]RYC17770.1 YicC family protein [Ciceribacter ferrooxidans]
MALQSMTGFARSEGTSGRYRWAWELRSVNGKGLDIRLRLPSGMEALEVEARQRLSEALSRGNLQVTLSVTISENRVEAVVNEDALAAVLKLRDALGSSVIDPSPMRLDALLSIRGLVEFREAIDSEEIIAARDAAILDGLSRAVAALGDMRRREGDALGRLLSGHVDRIEELARRVEADPSRSPEEIARKLEAQLQALLESAPSLDRDRLHAEAALLATKADLREEIDRLKAHVAAARELLAEGGPIGRKLDFLAQEFNRESNTICSKSNAVAVTSAGIELKVVIDQFREQVQNLE